MKVTGKKIRNGNIIIKLILIAFAIFAILILAKLQVQLFEEKEELAALTQEKAEKQATQEELEDLIKNGTKSDLIEKAARDKLDYVYKDDIVINDTTGN